LLPPTPSFLGKKGRTLVNVETVVNEEEEEEEVFSIQKFERRCLYTDGGTDDGRTL
jgi:hypothetical protein